VYVALEFPAIIAKKKFGGSYSITVKFDFFYKPPLLVISERGSIKIHGHLSHNKNKTFSLGDLVCFCKIIICRLIEVSNYVINLQLCCILLKALTISLKWYLITIHIVFMFFTK
jgi:hypothetical protein